MKDAKRIEMDETLLERLAEKVHERWMDKRLAEGWRRGGIRDDAMKTHPCLVDYAELPDAEKEYDRASVCRTLEGLRELGIGLVRLNE